MKYIIYKIQIKDYIYIGSTQNFTIRKAAHKKVCNNGKNFLLYKTIRENGGWDCCTMVPVKEVDVETKTQARILEEEMRVEYNAQMNSIRAYRSEAIESEYRQNPEYKESQKEYQKEYHKEYQQTPKYKEYRQNTEFKENKKKYQKEYQQTPKYKEYQKQWRLARKAKLAESPEIIVSA